MNAKHPEGLGHTPAKYKISELIDIDKVQELMEHFYELTGAPAAILDAENNILVAVGWQQVCTQFHRKHPETAIRCSESDAYINEHLNEGHFIEYKCKNGLWDLAYPIVIERQHLATIFFGQCFFEDEEPDIEFFIDQADRFGFEKEAYLKALEQVPRFSREYVTKILNWDVKLAQLLVEQGLDNLKRKEEIDRRKTIEQELQEHHDNLEKVVHERTTQLTETNRALKEEIEERKKIETALNNEKALTNEYIDSLPGLFYVFDEERFVRWNQQWTTVTGYSNDELENMYGTDFFEGPEKVLIAERMTEVFVEGVSAAEADLITKNGDRIPCYFTGMRKVIDGKPYLVGLGIDITERRKAQEEREKLIEDLQKALDEVKQLKGLIPICASCKKIRDDEGYWNSLESYIERYSDAQFSHGICEECAETLYKDTKWFKKKKNGPG